MEDKKEIQLSDLIKYALAHSIAQAFLIFSGVLVIVSVWKNNSYIFLSFFTLFYALINFKIEAIRKHPPLGNYVMRDNLGAGIYTMISWSLLIWWITGVMFLLNCVSLVDMFLKIQYYSFYLTAIWFLFLVFWMLLIFYRKKKGKNSEPKEGELKEKPNDFYKVECNCENCDLNRHVNMPKGIKVTDLICPECGIAQQLKKKTIKK